jgi:putative ABC transport system substrate-binding protein
MALLYLSPALAFDIAVVQTSTSTAYEKSYQGILQQVSQYSSQWGQKSISSTNTTRVLLNEENVGKVTARLRQLQPDIIIAIGRPALFEVMNYTDAPIIHVLAPFPPDAVRSNPRITGIDLNMPPEKQLSAFLDVFPTIKRIGTIYNPAESSETIRQAKIFAQIRGFEVIGVEAANDKEAIQRIEQLRNEVDALWMLPDRSLMTPAFTESLLRWSFEDKLPLLTFADKYLQMGATLSLAADPFAMGKQAGALALRTTNQLQHEAIPPVNKQYMETATLSLNRRIAQKIGAITDTAALQIPAVQQE